MCENLIEKEEVFDAIWMLKDSATVLLLIEEIGLVLWSQHPEGLRGVFVE